MEIARRSPAASRRRSGSKPSTGLCVRFMAKSLPAIIVGIQFNLAPVAAATSSLLGSFASLEQATVAATKALEAGASACELLDKTFLAYAASGQPADAKFKEKMQGAAAVLLAEVESYSVDSAAAAAADLAKAFREAGATDVEVALTPDAE